MDTLRKSHVRKYVDMKKKTHGSDTSNKKTRRMEATCGHIKRRKDVNRTRTHTYGLYTSERVIRDTTEVGDQVEFLKSTELVPE